MTLDIVEDILMRRLIFYSFSNIDEWRNSKRWALSKNNNHYYKDEDFCITIYKKIDGYRWALSSFRGGREDNEFSENSFESISMAEQDAYDFWVNYVRSERVYIKSLIHKLSIYLLLPFFSPLIFKIVCNI